MKNSFASMAVVIALCVVISFSTDTFAEPVLDIYSSTVINTNIGGIINIYDTPPCHTTVLMNGGVQDYFNTYNSSTLIMNNGSAYMSDAWNTSNQLFTGGFLYFLSGKDSSHVFIDGTTTVAYLYEGYGNSRMTMTGGLVGGIRALDSSVLTFYGGTGTGLTLQALNSSVVNFYEGYGKDTYLSASDSSVVNVYGSNFVMASSGGQFGYGYLTGNWIDGASFRMDFGTSDETYSHIVLHSVPEPATMLLLGLGLIGLAGVSRKIK